MKPATSRAWSISEFQARSYANAVAKGFWPEDANLTEKLALITCEVAELIEAHREDPLADCDKPIPLSCEEEEIADIFLRLVDFCEHRVIDLARVARIKHSYNLTRPVKHQKKF